MDEHVENVVHDRPSSRVADHTMDMMIPDEIKSDAALNRDTDLNFKTEDGTTMTAEQMAAGDSVDIVKVEPDLDVYMSAFAEYEAGAKACPVKTEPALDVDMAYASEGARTSRSGAVKTESEWDGVAVTSLENETENVNLITDEQESDATMECESGFSTLPIRVKLERDTATAESGISTDIAYPIKIESELDLNAPEIKDEPESAAEETESVKSQFYTATAAQPEQSTPADSIPVNVLPNVRLSTTALVQCPPPPAVQGLIPVKIVSNMPTTVANVIDYQGKSAVKRLYPVKFMQNMPGITAQIVDPLQSPVQNLVPAVTVPEISTEPKNNFECQPQTDLQNLIQVLPNVPAGTANTVENQERSPVKTLIPVEIVPTLPVDTPAECQLQPQPGLQRIIPVTVVQNLATAQGDAINNEAESSSKRLVSVRIVPKQSANSTMGYGSIKRLIPVQLVPNATAAQTVDSQTQPIVQRLVKIAPTAASVSGNATDDNFMSLPCKIESEMDLGTTTVVEGEGTVQLVENLFEGREYENNVDVVKVCHLGAPSAANGPAIHGILRTSPIDSGIKPKSSRKPRKEKLQVKKDIEFEIIPASSLEQKEEKRKYHKSQKGTREPSQLEIPEMTPEVAAELANIAAVIKTSTKTAAELVREHGPRIKELWKSCNVAVKKPGVKSKTNRRQAFKAWVMLSGEPGVHIMKMMAKNVADYTRKRREKIKKLAEAGDPDALEVFSRVLENRRKFIERRRALREAGGPAAVAMAQRARDRERKRRAQKAMVKAGNSSAMAVTDL